MLRIVLFVLVFMIICTAIGIETTKFINVKENKFSTVTGFVVFFCALQILYYPAQIFNLSFVYIIVVSILLLLIGLYFVVDNFSEVKKEIEQILESKGIEHTTLQIGYQCCQGKEQLIVSENKEKE